MGIIPAHAGLTNHCSLYLRFEGDHPRACGAHFNVCIEHFIDSGSSPRMRGSRRAVLLVVMSTGIIPAHAGLTSMSRTHGEPTWDHPRACGAHFSRRLNTGILGSSPRMRGSLAVRALDAVNLGIIPAHAGLTNYHSESSVHHWDHPRACGAHEDGDGDCSYIEGSSPRMRGSHAIADERHGIHGIIPAHAGLTLKNPNNDAILSVSNPIFYSVLRVIL